MKKRYIIRDDEEDILNSKGYKQIEQDKIKALDSEVHDSVNCDDVIYNIATVSEKPINNRIYPDEHIRDTVVQKKWLKPYLKPFLTNHDVYTEPLGRIVDSCYLEHNSLDQVGYEEKIPDSVIMKFKKEGFFDEGVGSVILKIKPFKDTLEKVKAGEILTTSQASATDSLKCSICDKDYYDCEHTVGSTYDGKKALLKTGSLDPYENSRVNRPANDSSVVLLYNTKDDSAIIFGTDNENVLIKKEDNKNEDFDKKENKTIIDEVKDEIKIEKKGDDMDKEKISLKLAKLKTRGLKDLSKALSLSDEKQNEFSLVLDSFSEEEILNVLDFVDLIQDELSETIKENLSLKDEVESLKSKILVLEAADTLKEQTADEEQDEDSEEQKDVEEQNPETEAEEEKDSEEQKDEETAKDSTKEEKDNINNNIVSVEVPDFLEQKEKKEKIEKVVDEEEDIFLRNLSNPLDSFKG